jgi:hypothetical protein
MCTLAKNLNTIYTWRSFCSLHQWLFWELCQNSSSKSLHKKIKNIQVCALVTSQWINLLRIWTPHTHEGAFVLYINACFKSWISQVTCKMCDDLRKLIWKERYAHGNVGVRVCTWGFIWEERSTHTGLGVKVCTSWFGSTLCTSRLIWKGSMYGQCG